MERLINGRLNQIESNVFDQWASRTIAYAIARLAMTKGCDGVGRITFCGKQCSGVKGCLKGIGSTIKCSIAIRKHPPSTRSLPPLASYSNTVQHERSRYCCDTGCNTAISDYWKHDRKGQVGWGKTNSQMKKPRWPCAILNIQLRPPRTLLKYMKKRCSQADSRHRGLRELTTLIDRICQLVNLTKHREARGQFSLTRKSIAISK